MTHIAICSNKVSAQDLSAFVEKDLLTVVDSLVSKPRKVLDNKVNKICAVEIWCKHKIIKFRIKPIFDNICHFVYNTGAFWNKTKLVQTIKYVFSQKFFVYKFEPLAREKLWVVYKQLFKISCHGIVFKIAWRVVRPKTEIHSVNNEAICRNLLDGVLTGVIKMPLTPFIIGNSLIFSPFNGLNQIFDKQVYFSLVYTHHRWFFQNPRACVTDFLAGVLRVRNLILHFF